MKKLIDSEVIDSTMIAPDIYSLTLDAPDIVSESMPGQFVSLYTSDEAHILPRPISICDTDREFGCLRLVYRIAGYGTKSFAKLSEGNSVRILGPLGNNFFSPYTPDEDTDIKHEYDKCIIIGGGIGIPPMLGLARELKARDKEVVAVLGYRDLNTFLADEIKFIADEMIIATDDGSVGVCGTVTDALDTHKVEGDVIYACGPMPMLKALKEYGVKNEIDVYLSVEQRMACGIGACLGCVCVTEHTDGHSMVHNARVCKDGPVFASTDIMI